MKHVWIVNHYAQHPGGPGGTRHYSLARHLPAFGWKASLIASSIEHGTGRTRLKADEARRLEVIDGVPFLWLRGGTYQGNGGTRIRNMLDYTKAVLNPRNLQSLAPPDVIIGSTVHPLAAWAGRRLARRHHVPFVFEVRDLWPQTLVDMGRLSPRSPMTLALRALEVSLYKSACQIITLLPKAGDYVESLGIPQDKVVWISNGVEVEGNEVRPQRPPDGEFVLMYLGSHGDANGIDQIVRAMRLVLDDPRGNSVRARLIGEGPRKEDAARLAAEIGATNVSFEDPIPKGRIPETAAAADAFVIYNHDLPELYKYGISMNKIFDYMAAGRPTIIASAAVNNPIAESNGGLTVRPGDPRALADAILDLATMTPAQRQAIGMAARLHVEERYSFEHLAGILARTLDHCVPK
jgi:glycosyltransferase involved in cell wall biosynthesis